MVHSCTARNLKLALVKASCEGNVTFKMFYTRRIMHAAPPWVRGVLFATTDSEIVTP
jgi:hypothetical protein